ncbi:uncharacterized protein LTHEOB_10115 [Lasiodiplodia theobromae]|uniref:uncharacterized protein n=1 Tax=Lasiodiplodia theobromae TaxID=45133 RepID=UPI0015C40248|nr:uncharacterized protein LTHEOB_10115 [Lasiodiplodia theobromae]KAF4539452.1 hypothetical protein LTHEOB_10115 [Lasiodiplodia theobromae]
MRLQRSNNLIILSTNRTRIPLISDHTTRLSSTTHPNSTTQPITTTQSSSTTQPSNIMHLTTRTHALFSLPINNNQDHIPFRTIRAMYTPAINHNRMLPRIIRTQATNHSTKATNRTNT